MPRGKGHKKLHARKNSDRIMKEVEREASVGKKLDEIVPESSSAVAVGNAQSVQSDVRYIEVGDFRLFDTKIGQGAFGKVYLCKGAADKEEASFAAKYIVFGDSALDAQKYQTALAETTKERDFLNRLKSVPYILRLESLFVKEKPSDVRQHGRREVILITEHCRGRDLKYGLSKVRKCFPLMRVAAAPAGRAEVAASGGLLHPHIAGSGTATPLPEGLVRIIAKQLLCALEGMKRAGVVHLDLKPANILLTEPLDTATVNYLNSISSTTPTCDLEIRLADFGFAKRVRAAGDVSKLAVTPQSNTAHPTFPHSSPAVGEADVTPTSPSSPTQSSEAFDPVYRADHTQTRSESAAGPHLDGIDEAVHDDGGTFLYMNLNRIRTKMVCFYDDLWAAGLVLYELLTGSRPPEWPACPDEHTHAHNLRIHPVPSIPYRPLVSQQAVDFLLLILDTSRPVTVEEMLLHPWLSSPGSPPIALSLPSVGEVLLTDFDVAYTRNSETSPDDTASQVNDTSTLPTRWSGPAASCMFSVFVHPPKDVPTTPTSDILARVVTLLPLQSPQGAAINTAISSTSMQRLRILLRDTINPLLAEASQSAPTSSIANVWDVDVVMHNRHSYIAVLHDHCLKGSLLGWLGTISPAVIANEEFARSKFTAVVRCAQWIKDARSVTGLYVPSSEPPFPVLPHFLHPLHFEVDANSNLRFSLAVVVVDILMSVYGQQPSLLQSKAGLRLRMFNARALHSEASRDVGMYGSTAAPPPFALSGPDNAKTIAILNHVVGGIPIASPGQPVRVLFEMEWSIAAVGLCLIPSLPKGAALTALCKADHHHDPEATPPTNSPPEAEKLAAIRDFLKLHLHVLLGAANTSKLNPRSAPNLSCAALDDAYDMSDAGSTPSPLVPPRKTTAPPSRVRDGEEAQRVSTTTSTTGKDESPVTGKDSPTNPTVSPTTEKGSPSLSVTTPGFSTCSPSGMGSRVGSTLHCDPDLPHPWSALVSHGCLSVGAVETLLPLLTPVFVDVSSGDLDDAKDGCTAASQQLLHQAATSAWLARTPPTMSPHKAAGTPMPTPTPAASGRTPSQENTPLPVREASLLLRRAELLLADVVPYLTRPADRLQVIIQATRFAYEVLNSVGVLYGSTLQMQEDEDLAEARAIAKECNELAGATVKELHQAVTRNGGLPRVFSMDLDYLVDKVEVGRPMRGASSSKGGEPEVLSEACAAPWYFIVLMRTLEVVRTTAREEIYDRKKVDFTLARMLFSLLSAEAEHDRVLRERNGHIETSSGGGASDMYALLTGCMTDMQQLEDLLVEHAEVEGFVLEACAQQDPPADDEVDDVE